MKRFILFLILCMLSPFVFGQIRIEGIVRDSLGVVKNANILNVSSNLGASSNDEGRFQIPVRLGDTLKVSSIQHETLHLIVANITLKERKLAIVLNMKVYELDEFELKPHDLSGFLGVDLNSVPKDNTPTFDAVSLGLPNAGNRKMTQIERKLYTATTGNGIIPLDLVINVLSGRLKRLKEESRLIQENDDVTYMYKNYRFFIQDYYGITEKNLYRFLYFCTSDPSYQRSILRNEIAMIGFLKEMAILFKKTSKTNRSFGINLKEK